MTNPMPTNSPAAAAAHSPTPWAITGNYVGHPSHKSFLGEISDSNGDPIFAGPFSFHALRGGSQEQAHLNAAMIVTAVNSHDALVAQRDALLKACEELDALVKRAQDVVRGYLPPDSGVSEHDAMNRLIEVLDCPEQHAAQQQAKAAIAKCREEGV